MKKINLKGISEILSEKELKNVMGGSGGTCPPGQFMCSCGSNSIPICVTYVCFCLAMCGLGSCV